MSILEQKIIRTKKVGKKLSKLNFDIGNIEKCKIEII